MKLLWTVCTLAGVGLLYCWTSRINAIFFFGRTVPAGFATGHEGRAITRRYLWGVGTATLMSGLMAWLLSLSAHPLYGLAVSCEVVLCLWQYAGANRRVQRLHIAPAMEGDLPGVVEVDLAAVPAYWVPGVAVSVLPALLASLAYGTALWRTGATGVAARATAAMQAVERHGPANLFGMGVGMLLTACVMLLAIRSSARLRTRLAQNVVRAMFALNIVGAVLICFALAMSLGNATLTHMQANVVNGAITAAALCFALWNQSRARRFVPAAVEMGADDRWRWGLFYVDRNDPALFVQSRCGAGYGLNYGKRLAWPITAAFFAYMVLVLFVLPLQH